MRKRHPFTGRRNFNGSVCRDCFNQARRERYRHDPFYRLARKRDTAQAYDPIKRREYMRRWRARKRAGVPDPDPEGDPPS